MLLLAANPLVKRIALDRLMLGFTERTSATVGADVVRQQLGYDGAGIGVAVIDSGVTAWHNDLADPNAPTTQRVDQFVDFVGGQSQPYDDYGHGTHVAGIIAGNGADSNGARTGIAPKARLVVLKVLDEDGRGRISDVIAAIDYAVAHKSEFNIRVLNMSIGAGVYESYNTDLLTLAAKRAVEEGLVVVAAAGNHGRNDEGVVQHGAISAPGNAPWVITVGAVEPHGHGQPRGRYHGGLQLPRSDGLRSRREAGSGGAGRGHLLPQQSGQHVVRPVAGRLCSPEPRARRTCRISA